jgi:hypothetical protein
MIGAIFLAVACLKLMTRNEVEELVRFVESLGVQYRRARLVARVIPPYEAVLGLALATGTALAFAAPAAGATAFGFLVVQIYAARRRPETTCACFGLVPGRPGLMSIGAAAYLATSSLAITVMPFLGAGYGTRVWRTSVAGFVVGLATVSVFTLIRLVSHFEKHRLRIPSSQVAR